MSPCHASPPCSACSAAEAGIVVTVDKSAQRLSVSVDGYDRYEWPVSTARRGYHTPNGSYRPERLARKWFSRKYDWSPMPYSIFFHGGYAIHGSYEISHLGRPASHGCIRLHPANAAMLFELVQEHIADTRIVVTGERPEREERSERARPRRGEARAPSRHGKTRRARHDFGDLLNDAPENDADLRRSAAESGVDRCDGRAWPGRPANAHARPLSLRRRDTPVSLFPLPQRGMERREAPGRLAQRP